MATVVILGIQQDRTYTCHFIQVMPWMYKHEQARPVLVKTLTMPIAPVNAYLDPMEYLPPAPKIALTKICKGLMWAGSERALRLLLYKPDHGG